MITVLMRAVSRLLLTLAALVIKSLLPQVPITVFSQLWVTHDQWFVNNFLQMAVQATLMTSTQRQSKCHKPILIFAIFQIYTKLPITNLHLVRNKQQSCSSTFPGCCCEDWEDKIIVGSVLSALWWCWDSSGLISADPRALSNWSHPALPITNPRLLQDNGRGVLDPTLWSLRPGARASAKVINLAK